MINYSYEIKNKKNKFNKNTFFLLESINLKLKNI